MPLGRLSRSQIQEAYSVLGGLSRLLEESKEVKKSNRLNTQLIGETTRFYTLIPHDFGLKRPPLLDSLEAIKAKSRMLEDLLELEVAYSIMKCGAVGGKVNPLDDQYANMRSCIQVGRLIFFLLIYYPPLLLQCFFILLLHLLYYSSYSNLPPPLPRLLRNGVN